MSSYLYPMRLQPQIIYPDVEPIFAEAPDEFESNFRKLPVIGELLMQQMAAGKLSKPNPFSDLLPDIFIGRPYDDEALDIEIYTFKSEWDRILSAERKITFATPQLSDILATEISYVRDNNFPFLDPSKREVYQQELLVAARVMLRAYGERGFRGLRGLRGLGAEMTTADIAAATAAANSIGPQNLPTGSVAYNDPFMQVFQQLSPYIQLAFAAISEVITGTTSVAVAAATGIAVIDTISASITTAINSAGGLVAATAMGQVFTMTLMAAIKVILAIMSCVSKWNMMKDQLRALIKASGQIRDAFHEVALKIVEATQAARDNTDAAMANFRLVMAEMIARILRGERILGLINCNADRTMWISLGVDPRSLRNTGTQDTAAAPPPGALTTGEKATLFAAGALLLAAAAGGRR